MAQVKYTARFKDGFELVKTDKEFSNRLWFYRWICYKGLGAEHGGLVEILMSILPADSMLN